MSENRSEASEIREQRRLRRLGTSFPRCGVCGETDSRCMERHHLAGQKNDPDTIVIVCRNCHRRLSDEQLDHPAFAAPHEHLKRTAYFMLGLADMLSLIVETLRKSAAALFSYENKSKDGDE